MSAYTDAAPDLCKAITATKFKSDNPRPIAPDPEVDEKPTLTKMRAVYNALLSLEQSGIGYSGIRRQTGVSIRWIKKIHGQMNVAKGAVWA